MVQYINSPEKDLSSGIDARSAENQIDAGFVKDLLNADVVEKRVRKRPGYQGFAGNMPVRITRLDYDSGTHTASFTLDSTISLDTAVSLETVRSSPIVVYGKSSTFTDGPFTTSGNSVKYYDKFSIPTRKVFVAPSGTLNIPASEHGFGTTNLFTSVVESTSLVNRSFTKVLTDQIRHSESSFDINIDYTTYQNKNVIVYFSDKSTATGSSYVATLTHTGSGSETFSIPTATHNLTNYNIVCQVQQDIGTQRIQVIPEQFIVESDGDVSITLNSAAATTFYVILSAAPISNVVSGAVNALSSGTVTITAPQKPWVFFGIYLEQTPGGNKEMVYPDTIDFDDSSNAFTLSFTNQANVARNFIVFYEYGDVRSNRLTVTDASIISSGTDLEPQLTMWGLDHEEIYNSKSEREGWVSHIDSYRRSGEQRLVSGLGGNLFSAQTYEEVASTYSYPILYPNLSARTNANLILGPVFYDTGDTPARTRGYITGDNSGTNWVLATSVEYDTGTGYTKYTLSVPNKAVLDSTGTPTSISNVISTTTNLQDYLTVTQMSYSRHNGTFRIRQIVDGIDEIEVYVDNSTNSSDYDDMNTGGQVGIFTDQMTWIQNAPFVSGDTLYSPALGSTFITPVVSSSGTTSVVSGFVEVIQVPGGVLFTGSRTSALIPMRSNNPNSVPSTTNLVRGDMLSYSGPDELTGKSTTARLLRVLNINPDSDRTCNISVLDGIATVTLTSGDTTYLTEGQKILITQAGAHSGVHSILELLSSTEFTYESPDISDTVTGAILTGEVVEVDEEFPWQDSTGDVNYFKVDRRWIPLEAPEDSFNQTQDTHVRYLDTNTYADQPFLRSTMVVDNMYFTNYDDEVYKYDGTSIYRAGLIPWQPGLFLTQETSGATIVTDLRTITYSAISVAEGRLVITASFVNVIPVGTKVRLSGSDLTYTVRDYTDDGTNYFLLVDRSLDSSVSASGTAGEIGVFRYYYRLNAVDANDNIVASAVTGYQDHVVELTGNAAIQHKIVGLPPFDNYDYDRLEVQIYRTKRDQAAPFYLITTLPMDFDNTQGYTLFTDSFADTDLTQLDIVNTALKGQELGTAFSDNLRSKYITSIGNKLIHANIKDYPELDIQIITDANVGNSSFANDTLLFRRDNADTLSTTNMVDRVKYEWINGFTGSASGFTIGTNQFTFTASAAVTAVAGSWVYLTYSTVATTARSLVYSGWWQIASVAGNNVTINLTGAASATSYPDKYVFATAPADVPVLLGVDGNLGMFNGDSFDIFDAMRRMSMAVNASMRMVDISLTGYESFMSWLTARGGNDVFPAGRMVVRQPKSVQEIMEIVPTFSGYNLFINQVKRATGDQVSASTRIFPSRLIASYENYPEIFDNPTSILDNESDSAVDVNSADGQEITGVIPFFGDATFTAAQQAAILVVFKTNSVYLVDLNQKAQGLNPVQRIETEGLGCTAPYSIAVTKNGIIFGNESGLYCLRRDQSIEYVGRFMERHWVERVDLDQLQIAQGHHYGVGRLYKISVPLIENESDDSPYVENTEVFTYNHTEEDIGNKRQGAWSRYDNHKAVGWSNLGPDAYFASSTGRVFSIRRTGTVTDFRDDNLGINFSLETRPNDFGNSGIRKILDKIIVHYRVGDINEGTALSYSVDLEVEYTPTEDFEIDQSKDNTGLDDRINKSIIPIAHSVGRRRGIYFSAKISNATIDEAIEIAGLDYKVGGLTNKGIRQTNVK